jgi:ABC-type iron transport system FetAB permease component
LNNASVFKGSGYLVSTVSVLLLGAVSWKSASEQPLLLAGLIIGMLASIVGMGLRWISHRIEQRQKKELEKAALDARPSAAPRQADRRLEQPRERRNAALQR